MEQYLVYQVRINLLQQNLVTFDSNGTDNSAFQKIAGDIVTLYNEIASTNSGVLMTEFIPQIENLCVILNTKKPFM